MKTYHMVAAIHILDSTIKEEISRTIIWPNLGCMGAEEVTTYLRDDGIVMRMFRSNGGCTLEIEE